MFIFPTDLVYNSTLFNTTLKLDQPILQVTTVAGSFSDQKNLTFRYNITDFTHRSIAIQLYFDHPALVSA
jgi:hypothetical protein